MRPVGAIKVRNLNRFRGSRGFGTVVLALRWPNPQETMEGRSDLSLVLPDTAIIHSPWRAALCTARQKPHAVAMLLVLGAMLALRFLYAGHFEYDTDEAQHLHVVWGWTDGQLAYRDFFDNHAPFFHLLCAP